MNFYCAAKRRDGRPCGMFVEEPSALFCVHHARLAERWGNDRVREGKIPKQRGRRQQRPVLTLESRQPEQPTPELVEAEVVEVVRKAIGPDEVRPKLAAAAAENLDDLQKALLETALGALHEHTVTLTCPDCGMTSRHQVATPDPRARLQAMDLLFREGLGRAPQSEPAPQQSLPDTPEKIKRMGWQEMEQLAARLELDSLKSALDAGAEKSLRAGIEKLTSAQRELLEKALRG